MSAPIERQARVVAELLRQAIYKRDCAYQDFLDATRQIEVLQALHDDLQARAQEETRREDLPQ